MATNRGWNKRHGRERNRSNPPNPNQSWYDRGIWEECHRNPPNQSRYERNNWERQNNPNTMRQHQQWEEFHHNPPNRSWYERNNWEHQNNQNTMQCEPLLKAEMFLTAEIFLRSNVQIPAIFSISLSCNVIEAKKRRRKIEQLKYMCEKK